MEFEEKPISGETGSQSPPSPPSPASPPPPPPANGRITVTIAAQPLERGVTLALPIQQHRPIGTNYPTGVVTGVATGGGGGGGGGREDCWSEGATEVLIEAWGERYLELKRGNLRQNHWKEVADIVSSRDEYSKTPKTDNQCKNRIDTVKKKFKTEKQRLGFTGGRSSWRFFDRIEELIGPLPKPHSTPSVFATGFDGTNVNVPLGIPVGVGAMGRVIQMQPERLKRKMGLGLGDYEMGSGSGDYERKKEKRGFLNGKRSWGETVRELSMAIVGLGEAYQEAELMKVQQMMEMEKHRMKFAKEMELQRMRFMTQTQMEISHMKVRMKMKEQESHRK